MEPARILLVEDDLGIQETLKEFLILEGHHVETANNGLEAIEKLEKNPVRLIILDLMMPIMNGWEFLAHRKEVPEFRQIPVITFSAAENPPSLDDHLRKPLDLDRFLALIEKKLSLPEVA